MPINKHNLERVEIVKSELIRETMLVLSQKVRMAERCLRIAKLLNDLDLYLDNEFLAIRIFNSDTDGYPVGRLIDLWDKKIGGEKDQRLKEIEESFKVEIFDACQKILDRLQQIN